MRNGKLHLCWNREGLKSFVIALREIEVAQHRMAIAMGALKGHVNQFLQLARVMPYACSIVATEFQKQSPADHPLPAGLRPSRSYRHSDLCSIPAGTRRGRPAHEVRIRTRGSVRKASEQKFDWKNHRASIETAYVAHDETLESGSSARGSLPGHE